MDYTLFKKIIELVEVYQEGHSSEKVEDFTIWLNNTLFQLIATKPIRNANRCGALK
jgi:hypothetical protein